GALPEPLPNIGLLICRLGESAEIEIGSDAMTRETWLNKKGLPLGSEKDGALGNRRRNQVDRLASFCLEMPEFWRRPPSFTDKVGTKWQGRRRWRASLHGGLSPRKGRTSFGNLQ